MQKGIKHRTDRHDAGGPTTCENERLAFDIETNGLDPDKIHCLVIKNIDDGFIDSYEEEGMIFGLCRLNVAAEIIGHNIIGYDIPSLRKVYPDHFNPKGKVTDTLVLSRLLRADLTNEDYEANFNADGLLPKRLHGSHSLAAWGMRIGLHKGDYTGGWETFSQEMLDYCVQDVEVTHELYKQLAPEEHSQVAIDFAHELATLCDKIGKFGWTFNMPAASKLYGELSELRSNIESELHSLFEPWDVEEQFIPKRNNKTKGYVAGEPFMKVKTIEFNPNSRRHIEFCLRKKYNWKPKLMTAQGHAQIDETVLSGLEYPEAQKLAKFFMIQKRIAQLAEGNQAWMKLTKNGKIHHSIIAPSTVTGRATHRNCNLAQVPATRLPFGKQCRELFTVQDGYILMGSDLSGLELRCLAFYMDNDDYSREVVNGDVHTVNQKAAGLSSRDQAKRFIYAYLYGAGPAKIGEVVNGGAKEGAILLKRFNERMPAVGRLRRAVEGAAERGYVKGLDGRHIKIRSPHKALNSLLQGAGATISAAWLLNIQKRLDEAELDADIMAWVHDEVQIQIREKDIEHVSNIVRGSAEEAGKVWFKERIPISADFTVGRTWADTH